MSYGLRSEWTTGGSGIRPAVESSAGRTDKPVALRLPNLVGDNMVLQAGEAVRLWGWAVPGEPVHVRFAGQSSGTLADADGRWELFLEPMEPCAVGRYLVVSAASGERQLREVLVGQVWVCSGQSNMAMRVAQIKGTERLLKAEKLPQVRAFNLPWEGGWTPREDVRARWREVGRSELSWLSAVACVFAGELHARLGQPVGLLVSHVGGSNGEAWIGRSALLENPRLKRIHEVIRQREAACPQLASRGHGYFRKWLYDFKAYWRAFCQWRDRAEASRGDPPAVPVGLVDKQTPSVFYNGMIAPLTRYTIKGFLWYQGEANANNVNLAYEYRHLLPTLITSWRKAWGRDDLPFYFVQLPDFVAPQEDAWALMRESMLKTMREVPHTGMAVTIGLGEPGDIHPPDKIPVGQRLARIALAKTYGVDLVYSGPLFERVVAESGRLRLTFSHAAGGLEPQAQVLDGFQVASADGPFVPAQAVIEDGQVIVSSESVPHPVHVRYAWANNVRPSLFNTAGLPATPFRTDTRLLPGQMGEDER
ncbi:MAG: sialate O-acetylesterase [Verrucomicrobiota bacterium JB024]|nr:sialate O-acetylesterase [Verrucomicrobiota bacterium JB024]